MAERVQKRGVPDVCFVEEEAREHVRLAFAVPAVSGDEELRREGGHRRDDVARGIVGAGGEGAQDAGDDRGVAGVPPAAVRVTALHVGDLVREDRGQLVLRLERFQEAAGDEDVAGRRGEGVDVVGVDHLEAVPVPLERHRPAVEDAGADAIDVRLPSGVDVRVVGGPYRLQREHRERSFGLIVRYGRRRNETDPAPAVTGVDRIGLVVERITVRRRRQVVRAPDVERAARPVADVAGEVGLGRGDLEDFVEPPFEVRGGRRRPVEVDTAPAEALAADLESDVVVLRVRVDDADRFALAEGKEPVAAVQHERLPVFDVQIQFSASFRRRAHDEGASFERVFEVVPPLLRLGRPRIEQGERDGERKQQA